jgi:hypothetical protein
MLGALLLVGTGMQMASQSYGAWSALKQSQYQQDIAKYAARYSAAAQKIDEQRLKRNVRQVVSSQRSATAAQGFENTGTPQELEIETQMMGELDMALLRMSGGIERLRLQTGGTMARAEGYGLAAGLAGRAAGTGLNTLLTYGTRAGWFNKDQSLGSSLSATNSAYKNKMGGYL